MSNQSNYSESDDENNEHNVFENEPLEEIIDVKKWVFKKNNQKLNLLNLFKIRSGQFVTKPKNENNDDVIAFLKDFQVFFGGKDSEISPEMQIEFLRDKHDYSSLFKEQIQKQIENYAKSMQGIQGNQNQNTKGKQQIRFTQSVSPQKRKSLFGEKLRKTKLRPGQLNQFLKLQDNKQLNQQQQQQQQKKNQQPNRLLDQIKGQDKMSNSQQFQNQQLQQQQQQNLSFYQNFQKEFQNKRYQSNDDYGNSNIQKAFSRENAQFISKQGSQNQMKKEGNFRITSPQKRSKHPIGNVQNLQSQIVQQQILHQQIQKSGFGKQSQQGQICSPLRKLKIQEKSNMNSDNSNNASNRNNNCNKISNFSQNEAVQFNQNNNNFNNVNLNVRNNSKQQSVNNMAISNQSQNQNQNAKNTNFNFIEIDNSQQQQFNQNFFSSKGSNSPRNKINKLLQQDNFSIKLKSLKHVNNTSISNMNADRNHLTYQASQNNSRNNNSNNNNSNNFSSNSPLKRHKHLNKQYVFNSTNFNNGINSQVNNNINNVINCSNKEIKKQNNKSIHMISMSGCDSPTRKSNFNQRKNIINNAYNKISSLVDVNNMVTSKQQLLTGQ
ncbi:hypothetical protein PPERSA_05241 [Pseudocohnilembus persalinus]|uniref:Uncharacterized protein n=1 Tax=Pseudocohnilembus persalinus TaxID=266149 RepID=A0A0V0QYV8_PSEPJ|nr:hypothetical protein PPERSA_05241 [Pseudocohnilembus persalinus]|eukprot:KRX07077.1 hypothetical protein PPERSA_05241 [Pseudocohnilembus persalinus]